MEAKLPPVVIPMWVTGFDQLMPEGRPFPYNYIPRVGARLGVIFGDPIAPDELLEALCPSTSHSNASQSITSHGSSPLIGPLADGPNTALIRQRVMAIIHREVERLGVSTRCIDSS
jgi:monolysocardiolipin acyltransferase